MVSSLVVFFLYYEDWIISSLKLELKIFKILFQGFQYYTQIWVYFRSLIVDFPEYGYTILKKGIVHLAIPDLALPFLESFMFCGGTTHRFHIS